MASLPHAHRHSLHRLNAITDYLKGKDEHLREETVLCTCKQLILNFGSLLSTPVHIMIIKYQMWLNKVFKDQCELPILDLWMLSGTTLWTTASSDASKVLCLDPEFIPTTYAYQQLLHSQRWPSGKTVIRSTRTCGSVRQNDNNTFVVDLWFCTCSCGHFQ